jgi:5,10-methylenetetrahydrofolate reductase
MGAFACPFTNRAPVAWSPQGAFTAGRKVARAMDGGGLGQETQSRQSFLDLAQRRPVVLTDFTVRPYDVSSIAEVCAALEGSCDAVLIGEHNNRPDFPPAMLMPMIRELGLASWVTLTCRDRNRIVLEQELAALSVLGGEGVLCVTGDGRGVGVRPGVTSVFDLDSSRLSASAAQIGLSVAVAESPQAPPEHIRPYRLLQKQRAGARVCFLNHVSTPERLARFIADARSEGVTLPFVAGVAVYTDARSAAVLQAFPGLHLDAGAVSRVLSDGDPVRAGIDAAVAEARQVLAVPGVVGVNISGLASAAGELAAARIKATVGRAVLGL